MSCHVAVRSDSSHRAPQKPVPRPREFVTRLAPAAQIVEPLETFACEYVTFRELTGKLASVRGGPAALTPRCVRACPAGRAPESPARLTAALAGARAAGVDLHDRPAREATAAELERVHPAGVPRRARADRGGGAGSTPTPGPARARCAPRGSRQAPRARPSPRCWRTRRPRSAPCARRAITPARRADGLLPDERGRGRRPRGARRRARARLRPRLGRPPRQRHAGHLRATTRGAHDLAAPERPLARHRRARTRGQRRRGGRDAQHHVPRRHRAGRVPRALRGEALPALEQHAPSSCSCRAASTRTATTRSPDSRSRTRRSARSRARRSTACRARRRGRPGRRCSRAATTSGRSSAAAREVVERARGRPASPVRRSTMPRVDAGRLQPPGEPLGGRPRRVAPGEDDPDVRAQPRVLELSSTRAARPGTGTAPRAARQPPAGGRASRASRRRRSRPVTPTGQPAVAPPRCRGRRARQVWGRSAGARSAARPSPGSAASCRRRRPREHERERRRRRRRARADRHDRAVPAALAARLRGHRTCRGRPRASERAGRGALAGRRLRGRRRPRSRASCAPSPCADGRARCAPC